MFDKIPKGWRFYTADCSIEGQCTIMLKRDATDTARWHRLSNAEWKETPLYSSGRGVDFESALNEAIKGAYPLYADYTI